MFVFIFRTKYTSLKMSELYQVKEIEGKGVGCVATRDIKSGTLILSETPQLIFGKDPSLK